MIGEELSAWLELCPDGDTGRTELLVYAVARLAGHDAIEAAQRVERFEDDARVNWSSTYSPRRREVFETAERVLLAPQQP